MPAVLIERMCKLWTLRESAEEAISGTMRKIHLNKKSALSARHV